MNLLVLSINYAPEPTGFAPHVTDLCKYLSMRQHDVTVITGFPFSPLWRRYDGYTSKLISFECSNGVKLIRLPHFIPKRPSSIFQRILMEGTFCIMASFIFLKLVKSKWDVVLYIGAQPSIAASTNYK